jgi:hypothetical protein
MFFAQLPRLRGRVGTRGTKLGTIVHDAFTPLQIALLGMLDDRAS